MDFFNTYTSNTTAGSGTQYVFCNEDPERPVTARTLYRVTAPGEYRYSVLFSNILDSTFADGSVSHCNQVMDEWEILSARIGLCRQCDADAMEEPYVLLPMTFDGCEGKQVHPGEFFSSDPVALAPQRGEYICVEMTFRGGQMPNHEESIVPSFVLTDKGWMPSKRHPFASMVGIDRRAVRIGFLGDSITQGCGTEINSYTHWNAVAAECLGEKYACWNLGLGYARAADAATDGAWLYKAKHNDYVVVCFGVNDILQGYSEAELKRNLARIVDALRGYGVKVVLQTVPPFDYAPEKAEIWRNVNAYILTELAERVEMVFDCVPLLSKGEDAPHMAAYGGHPDARGCRIWGQAIAQKMRETLGL